MKSREKDKNFLLIKIYQLYTLFILTYTTELENCYKQRSYDFFKFIFSHEILIYYKSSLY